MRWTTAVSSIVYYTLYPVFWLLTWLLYIVYWILSPFIYLGYVFKQSALLPVRFLARFEPVWYFLGSAILVGAALATLLHFVLRVFVVVFDLDRRSAPKPTRPTGHDAVSYRRARQEKKQKELEKQQRFAAEARLMASQPLMQEAVREARQRPNAASSANILSPGTGRPALLEDTILEHTDEELDDSSTF